MPRYHYRCFMVSAQIISLTLFRGSRKDNLIVQFQLNMFMTSAKEVMLLLQFVFWLVVLSKSYEFS